VPEAGLSHDIAQLSSVGTQVAQATSLSDVRMDKVAAIQSALQAGSYEVSASDVAQKIVESMIESGK
jgi:flagellar biosynthesis anti-sigma factor FlgM